MAHAFRDSSLALPLAVVVVSVLARLLRGFPRSNASSTAVTGVGVAIALGLGAPLHGVVFDQAAGVHTWTDSVRHGFVQGILALPVSLAVSALIAAIAQAVALRPAMPTPRNRRRVGSGIVAWSMIGGAALVTPATIGTATPAGAAGTVCPVGARPVVYDLAAFETVIPINGWGDKVPSGLVYALKSRKDAILANPNLTQPLVVRANVGDCITIKLRNDIVGRRIGIHPDGLVQFDPETSDGAAVGRNPDTTVATGTERTFTWYADHVGEAPINDIANLDNSVAGGSTMQLGLYGAVVVHPTGTRWRNQITGNDLLSTVGTANVAVETQLFADIVNGPATLPAFRSYTLVLMDEVENVVDRNGMTPINPINGLPQSTFGINYRSEPLRNRMRAVAEYRAGQVVTLPSGKVYDPSDPNSHFCDGWDPDLNGPGKAGTASPDGIAGCISEESHLQSWVFGDEGKLTRTLADGSIVVDSDNLISKAYKGDPVRFHIVHPGAKETHPWHQHTQRWFADPNNPSSPRNDVQAVGPGESYPLVLEKGAGGLQGTIGDSIYHCHLYPHFADGMWGHLRIFDRLRDGSALTTGNSFTLFNGVRSNQYPDGTPIEPLQPLPGNPPPSATNTTPGYPLFVAGVSGQRAYRPPFAVVADTFQNAVDAQGRRIRRPGDTVRTPTALERAGMPALDPNKPGAGYIDPCPGNATPRTYNPQAVDVPIVYNKAGWNDPEGRIYVEGDAGRQAVLAGKQAEPYTIRSRIGDCVTIKLTNNLHLDDDPTKPVDILADKDGIYEDATQTSEISTHVHLVEFDELGTDGTSVGWNYVQAAMPGQTYGYRWYVDTALRTVFFHDHQYANLHQQKGLFAAMNVEPADATWHDPATGLQTNGVGTVADIRSATGPDFREMTVFQQDRSPMWRPGGTTLANAVNPPGTPDDWDADQGGYALNYRNEPFQTRSNATSTGLKADPAYIYSSVVHGDPSTPIFRAYSGDPTIIRHVVGAHEEVHTFGLHGHRWLSEPDNPLSTISDNAGMALAEWMNYSLISGVVVKDKTTTENTRKKAHNTVENGTPAILTGGAGAPGDYRYGSMALDDQWLGNWGIFRVPGARVADLQPLPDRVAPATGVAWPALAPGNTYTTKARPAPSQTSVCVKGAPLRTYNVDAITRDIVYDPATGDHDPSGLQYKLTTDTSANPGPLFLRANAGDCIKIVLTNKLKTWNGAHADDVPLPADNPFPWGQRVGLHASLVDSLVTQHDGAAVGYNFDSTVAPGQTITYYWSVPADLEGGTGNIIDLGDRRGHVHHGLFGGILVEPKGSTWTDPVTGLTATTGASADIHWTDAAKVARKQREFVVAFQDGLNLRTAAGDPVPIASVIEDPYELGNRGINYRTARMGPRSVAAGSVYAMSSILNGDPATPVFQAHAKDAVNLRVLQSSDRGRAHTFIMSGHSWNYQPRDPASTLRSTLGTVMSGRSFSVWFSGGAGGPLGLTGDYLFRDGLLPNQVNAGLWGIVRVLPTTSKAIRRL